MIFRGVWIKDKEMVFGGWDVLYDLRGGRSPRDELYFIAVAWQFVLYTEPFSL